MAEDKSVMRDNCPARFYQLVHRWEQLRGVVGFNARYTPGRMIHAFYQRDEETGIRYFHQQLRLIYRNACRRHYPHLRPYKEDQ